MQNLKKNIMERKFDLAISFAGEDRSIALEIANVLSASGYNIFYDDFFKADLWGSELPVKLGEIYSNQARYCLMIISKYYIEKMWTNHERKFAIQNMVNGNADYILPLKIDNSTVPGFPSTIGYISLSSISINEICSLLTSKIGNPSKIIDSKYSAEDLELCHQIIQYCFSRAIFTKMDSEIKLDAMYYSIEKSISQVQKLIPKIQSQYLQTISLNIVTLLDQIERFRLQTSTDSYSYNLPKEIRIQIDKLKIDVIMKLHMLRRESNLGIVLPTNVMFDHFFSIKQAIEKPRT